MPMLSDKPRADLYASGLARSRIDMSSFHSTEQTPADVDAEETARMKAEAEANSKKKKTVLDIANGACAQVRSRNSFDFDTHYNCLTVESNTEYAKVLSKPRDKRLALTEGKKEDALDVISSSAHGLISELFLPEERAADVVLLDFPGTLMSNKHPFQVFEHLQKKKLITEDTQVVPQRVCFEVALVKSSDLASMYYIPDGGMLDVPLSDESAGMKSVEIDLQNWNREIVRKDNVYKRMVKLTKWLSRGGFSRMRWKALSSWECVFSSDFFSHEDIDSDTYGEEGLVPGQVSLKIEESGEAHALVGRWKVFGLHGKDIEQYPTLAHDLYTANYVQMLNANANEEDEEAKTNPEPITVKYREDVVVKVKKSETKFMPSDYDYKVVV